MIPTPTDAALYPKVALDAGFHPASRVWVYVAERPLTAAEQDGIQQALEQFTRNWTAHNDALHAGAEVFAQQVILLYVDETRAGASGCSIDKSVHFLEQLSRQFQVDLFDRMRFGWVHPEKGVVFSDKNAFAALVKDGMIHSDTPVIHTLAGSVSELREHWLQPYGQSWHARLMG
jgi:hypothetical protein